MNDHSQFLKVVQNAFMIGCFACSVSAQESNTPATREPLGGGNGLRSGSTEIYSGTALTIEKFASVFPSSKFLPLDSERSLALGAKEISYYYCTTTGTLVEFVFVGAPGKSRFTILLLPSRKQLADAELKKISKAFIETQFGFQLEDLSKLVAQRSLGVKAKLRIALAESELAAIQHEMRAEDSRDTSR